MRQDWRWLVLVGAVAVPAGASAQQFNGGIPADWACVGNCGTGGADGVVTASPAPGSSAYGWVSTLNGAPNGGLSGIGGTNGSTLTSVLFSADAGDELNFFFNYVTSDGAGFADYAWSRLLNADNSEAALLFTARTDPTENIVPGTGMPAPNANLTPMTVSINLGTTWSPLGGSSGDCWAAGCGHSGWVFSQFMIPTAGNYFLEFGVTNWGDTAFDSGLAFDGLTVGGQVIGVPPTVAPEPVSMLLLGTGLLGVGAIGRRRRRALEA